MEKKGKQILAIFGLAMTLFFVRPAICQSLSALPDSIRIARVIVVGNVHTKTPIILRELEFRPGDTVSKRNLILAKKRIENLYLFNRVQFVFLRDEGKTDLKIVVTERWYIFPIPILNFNEHSFSKISYGGGVVHYNFRGRAEKLFFLGWAGFNPGLKFAYRNDWFGGEKRYFTSFFLHSIRVTNHTNRFTDLTSLSRRALFRFGRRFGIYRYVGFQTKIEQVNPSNPLAAIHSSGRDLWGQVGVFLKYDSRDLHEYPLNGYLAEVSLAHAWLNQSHRTSQSLSYDIRAYRDIHSIILAGRTAGAFRTGTIPVYEHIFLGYDQRIRGHFFESYEGENRVLASAALRFALVPKRYYNLSRKTASLKELEFAVYGTLFSDTGLVFNQRREVGIRHFQSGFGVGLNVLLPYSNSLRFEYAWNESLRGQFIFDGGVAF
ncbi:MAG: hypothetical protein GXO76_01160 [Calditrichaeota bacterium]|nr:hypothetical protein [Calditrichota bacterium]